MGFVGKGQDASAVLWRTGVVRLVSSFLGAAVAFACLRLSLGWPQGATVFGGRLKFVGEGEDVGTVL